MSFSDEEVKEAFDSFDSENKNFISADDIRVLMDAIGEYVTDQEVDEMIRMLDCDGKGQVAFEQFYRMAAGQPLVPVGTAHPPSFGFQFAEPDYEEKDMEIQAHSRPPLPQKLPELPLTKTIKTFNIDSKTAQQKVVKAQNAPSVSIRKKQLGTPSQASSFRVLDSAHSRAEVSSGKSRALQRVWRTAGEEEEDPADSIVISAEDLNN